MDYSGEIPAATVRLVAAVLYGMLWTIVGGFLLLVYIGLWASSSFVWIVLGLAPFVAAVVCGLLAHAPDASVLLPGRPRRVGPGSTT